MMANPTFHTVYVPDGIHGKRAFSDTAENLRANGWEPGVNRRGLRDDWVLDVETGRKLDGSFDYWDADGDDAWVSVESYDHAKAFKILK